MTLLRNKHQPHEMNRGNQHSNKEKYSEDVNTHKHPHYYRLIDDIVGSSKTYKCMSTKFYQINRGSQHSDKQKFPCFDEIITQEAKR